MPSSLPAFLRRLGAVTAIISLVVGCLVFVAAPASAAIRTFTPVYTTNTTGDVIIRGNSLETCQAGTLSAGSSTNTCANVQGGGTGANNNFFMSYIDTDSDTTTINSSSATVTIPAGATVLYAGLSWSATAGAGSLTGYPALTGVAAPTPTAKATVSLKVPGSSTYTSVTAPSALDSTGSGYQGFANVTSSVQAAGSGSYTVANVQAGTGGGNYAGWTMAVAYRDPSQPVRNLAIYTGFANVRNGDTTSIPITGFTTPLTGAVVTRLGTVVYEGDKGNTGDSMSLGPNAITNALNPVNDVENSSMSDLGVAVTARSPAYTNTLGVDIDRFDATGFLTNGQTSTTITLKTVGDSYYPGLISLATNLYSPSLQATKSVRDVTRGIASNVTVADVLSYTMAITNVGGDGSVSSVLTDAVPTGTTYVPGSLIIGGTAVTDAAGDDAGTVTSGTVTARLGTGATATAGGSVASNASTTVKFNATVNSGVTAGTVISNAAALGYSGATTATAYVGSSNTVSSTVSSINVNPVLAFAAPPSGEVSAAYTSTLTAAGGTGPYTWAVTTGSLPAGLTLNATTGVVSGTPTASGFSSFTVSATDSNAQVATQATSVYIAPQPVLAYPSTLQNADTNNAYSYPLGVTPGTGPYAWSVSVGTLPTGLTLDASTGVIAGTPTVAGTSTFTVRVVDSYGASATESTTLTVLAGPSLSYPPSSTGDVGTAYSNQLVVLGGTSPYIWTTTGTLPAGISIDASSGLLSGTPTAVGTSSFTVTVTDVNGATASEATTIVVVAAPTLTGTLSSGEVSAPYSSRLTVNDGVGPFVWTVGADTLPPGLSLDAATGLITGTPTDTGDYPVRVKAVDANGATATRTQTITVVAAPTLAGTLAGGEVSAPYSSGFTVSDGVGPFTWSVSAGTLPDGLSISTSTGLVTGRPTATGSSSITVSARDANNVTATRSDTIVVGDGPGVTFTAPTGEVSVAYSAQPAVSGGTGPYTWAVSAGTLPAGLAISASTGAITGTPSAAGSSNVTVQVTDANGGTATQARTITIVAAPTLTFAAPPAGERGAAYSDQLTKSGGVGPFTWSVSAGTLPPGLTLASSTGLLSGAPTTVGTSTFTVRIVDANGLADTKAATLVVAKTTSTVSVSAPATLRFGTTVTVTAALGPSSVGGTVTFTDVATTGPQAGNTTTLGTSTVSGAAASLTTTLSTFGRHTIRASYGGDAAHTAVTSTTTQVEVSAYAGEVIVSEFRTSGPGGAGDNYVELLNTGPTVPLAGITVSSDSGVVSTLPANAGLLGTGRSYLVTGAGFTLAATATSDYSVATVGTGGMKVTAPDTAATVTDAVGPATGFHTGTGLPAITGNPDSQWAWVRTEGVGVALDTGDNAADFQLVSTGYAAVGGVQPTLGSASPTGTADPYQHNDTLRSSRLDGDKGVAAAPNRVVVTGTPTRLVLRRTITNSSSETVTAAKVRVAALSEQYGAPQSGVSGQPARVAWLRAVNPAASTEQVTLTSGATVTVNDLSVDTPNSAGLGGGLNSTFSLPLPGGGLAPGASINVAFTFAVVTRGTFWFGYDVDATTTAAPAALRANRAAARTRPASRKTIRLLARHSATRHAAARVTGHLG